MKIKDKVLIIEDEANISNFISTVLTANGYDTLVSHTGSKAITLITSHCPDLILLDLGLPDMDGTSILKFVREWSTCPIIVVSARNHERDKVEALDAGADDYIVKPFDGKEMAARVRAVLRRTQGAEEETGGTLAWPGLTVSIAEYEARYEGKPLDMPPKELEVLYFLASHPNQVFTREQLLQQVWGFDFFGDSRTVDVHIKRVREKLPDSAAHGWSIETVRGVGYKFAVKR